MKIILDQKVWQHVIDKCIEAAKLATCHRSKCGSIIVHSKTGMIVSAGCNSFPYHSEKLTLCRKDNLPTDFKSDKTCCIHAEQRAIMNAMNNSQGLPMNECYLFFIRLDENDQPTVAGKPYCTICSKMALDVGLKRFVLWHEEGWTAYDTNYYNELSFQYTEEK